MYADIVYFHLYSLPRSRSLVARHYRRRLYFTPPHVTTSTETTLMMAFRTKWRLIRAQLFIYMSSQYTYEIILYPTFRFPLPIVFPLTGCSPRIGWCTCTYKGSRKRCTCMGNYHLATSQVKSRTAGRRLTLNQFQFQFRFHHLGQGREQG